MRAWPSREDSRAMGWQPFTSQSGNRSSCPHGNQPRGCPACCPDLSLQAGNREQRAGRISPEAHKGPLPATKSRIPTPQVCPRPLPPTWDPRSPSCPGQTQFWAPAIPRNTSLPCSLCRVAGNISCWSSRPHCAQRSHSFILSVSQSTLSAHCGLVQGPGTVLLTARGRSSE